MVTMRDIMDRENIRALVARDITCQQTGKVLDKRTCLVVRDSDGDPIAVLDPSCADSDVLRRRIENMGWSLDTRSRGSR